MENKKLLTQELVLIDSLLESVNSKQEYNSLISRAKKIVPFWISPVERLDFPFLFSSGSDLEDIEELPLIITERRYA